MTIVTRYDNIFYHLYHHTYLTHLPETVDTGEEMGRHLYMSEPDQRDWNSQYCRYDNNPTQAAQVRGKRSLENKT